MHPRRDSMATLWEKVHERSPQTQKNAPFASQESGDALENSSDGDEDERYESTFDISSPIFASLPTLPVEETNKPWQFPTKQKYLIIIIDDSENIPEIRQALKRTLNWTNEEEEVHLRSWFFGLSVIRLQFNNEPQLIDLPRLCLASSKPLWLTFKKEKQLNKRKQTMDTSQKPLRHQFTTDFDVALRYGALINLKDFRYSPQHSWQTEKNTSSHDSPVWFLVLDEKRKGDGRVEWTIENGNKSQQKQLLVNNIDHVVIVNLNDNGFEMYICQKCNMNEFQGKTNSNDRHSRDVFRHPAQPNRSGSNGRSSQSGQRPISYRSHNKPRPPPLLQTKNEPCQEQQRAFYEYERVGEARGSYFSTVQFSLHSSATNRRHLSSQTQQTLSLLIDFFLEHKITVCYGKINATKGPTPYLFLQPRIPDFSSLMMKYSWQMLSINGYRLQLRIDDRFLHTLFGLIQDNSADELFYRVCVYLSRIFALKPFININDELNHALTESIKKRDAASYGLVRKVDTTEENETYIPSITLTPTTIRIKPLKLCRTNRVLRAVEQFGKPLYHFALVDIRDENGRMLPSFHFRHLHNVLLDYLQWGFTLMDDNRTYKYLHHSQSQLRERQFWFYHHNAYEQDVGERNLNFSEAYRWMGDFSREKNPAKYAARMALCFSTTKTAVRVQEHQVTHGPDIDVNIHGRTLTFTDGCGTMSEVLRDQIKRALGFRDGFSAVQFRYGGAKGVVSVDTRMKGDKHLYLRPSMKKFVTDYDYFEVCKISAPRPLFLNRQAILLLSYRRVRDTAFLMLQQQNHLRLIRALLRNSDAEKLILEKTPIWFLTKNIHEANIDFIHEPFFRQLLISSCLQSTRELLQRTRIRVPRNEGRNMMGIVDEYSVLKPDEVFVQYTILDEYPNSHRKGRTEILHKRKVVITKNPCHHPGDVRTFTAVNYPQLKHLKDVVVFSQQGDRPAPHAISGSDLDGDEYSVVWHEDLVPYDTDNAQPYDYDAHTPQQTFQNSVEREHIDETILRVSEQDCLGRLSNLHLAFADKFGVDNDRRYSKDVLSTIELAGAISREVDSGKTGDHPLNEKEMKNLNNALEKKRPDYMDNPNFISYQSPHILGKLFRAMKGTLPGWKQLLRYHRHLRHLEIRTHDELEENEEEADDSEQESRIRLDSAILVGVDRYHRAYAECAEIARKLASVYRQEIFEILTLYGLSHESDLWCRNSINGLTGELEDTALTELEQLVVRTRTHFFNAQVTYCETGLCHDHTLISELCGICAKRQRSMAGACYDACYGVDHELEQAPILSLPWLFATPLVQNRIDENQPPVNGLLGTAMKKTLKRLLEERRHLVLNGIPLSFRRPHTSVVMQANVDNEVCIFVEILQQYLAPKKHSHWPLILSQFVRRIESFSLVTTNVNSTEQWELLLEPHKIHETDLYAAVLASIEWTEREDKLMHEYFDTILKICFDEGRQTNDINYLQISDDIILLLQKMAINETIF